jgi:ATP-grasp domain
MPPTVLLTDTTRWPVAARLAINLSKAGIDVSAACLTRGHPLLNTRTVRQIFAYSPIRPVSSLIAAIEATNPQLIIPCDDRAVRHLHELHAHARDLGRSGSSIAALVEHSLGPPESYPIVSARYDLLTVAREEGLRVPEMKLVRAVDDLKSWRTDHAFPWVLKADGTFGGRGVRIADTLEHAEQSFSKLTGMFGIGRGLKRLVVNRDPFWLRPWWEGWRPPVIAQSYIHGRPANCAVVCWEGKVLAGIGVDVVSTSGWADPATVVRVVERPEMMHAAERIASRLKLSGFFGLDFMIEEGTGSAYLIEMNPRCTPLCHLQLGKGHDMIGALWAQLSGNPPGDMRRITQNDMIAYFPQAWLSKSEFLSSCFQDAPWEEPGLIEELLSPWPERTRFSRAFNWGFVNADRTAHSLRTLFSKARPIGTAWSGKEATTPRNYDV